MPPPGLLTLKVTVVPDTKVLGGIVTFILLGPELFIASATLSFNNTEGLLAKYCPVISILFSTV